MLQKLNSWHFLVFFSGVKRARHTNFRDLWATDGSEIEFFRACMTYNRFLFLLTAILFNDKSNRYQRKTTDKLAVIRFILDEFVKNFNSPYCLSVFFKIDEMLVPFRGRWGFIIQPHSVHTNSRFNADA